jgi:hypothetical protein
VWARLTCEPADIYTSTIYAMDDVAAVLPPSLAEYLAFLAAYLPVGWQDYLAAVTFRVQPIQVGGPGPGRGGAGRGGCCRARPQRWWPL